jgi:hypothetical protein
MGAGTGKKWGGLGDCVDSSPVSNPQRTNNPLWRWKVIVIKIHVTTRLITLHTRLAAVNNRSIIQPLPSSHVRFLPSYRGVTSWTTDYTTESNDENL